MMIIEQKTRMKFLRFSADLQQVAKVEKKKRQPILLVCRLLSEWGDSNARPLRPERSALPTALHSDTFFEKWCHQESNRGHKDFQSFALPTELWHLFRLRVQR